MLAVVLLSFTVPKIYELKKHEIDTAAKTGFQKVSNLTPLTLARAGTLRAACVLAARPVHEPMSTHTAVLNADEGVVRSARHSGCVSHSAGIKCYVAECN